MAKPFVKHPGGKRDHIVLPVLMQLIQNLHPQSFFDMTLGGGSVFFALEAAGLLKDKLVVLGDADRDLINLYDAVRKNPRGVQRLAAKEAKDLAETPPRKQKATYNMSRELFNLGDKKPGLQLFLRHACFNGLFRRNRAGKLNTPPRDRLTELSVPSLDDLLECASALDKVELLDWDFRQYEEHAFISEGDLVYLDPPFDAGFVQYVANGFTNEDQSDLIQHAAEWSRRGAIIVYSNAATLLIRDLLAEHWPEAKVEFITAKRAISSDGNREPAPEFIVHNTNREVLAHAT